jgi:phosphotransferase system HPr-like phosphotransfer protein
LAKSVVTVSSISVESGKTIDVTLQAEDAYVNEEAVGRLIVAFELSNMNGGGQGTFCTVTGNHNGT